LVLLSQITSLSKTELLAHPNPDLLPDQEAALEEALEELRSGIPLAYVLGRWEFFQLDFVITPDVLIPRPESEWLVEKGISWLQEHPDRRRCLDLGTGSGCLGVSLAKRIPNLRIIATDRSFPALLVAAENVRRHGTEGHIDLIACDLYQGIQPEIDLLIANLPYIPSSKLNELPAAKTEPRMALDGGPDGLSYIRRTLEGSLTALLPGGLILMELDETCGENALSHAGTIFPRADINLKKDLSGLDRYLEIQT
jgi:release factor glutamine methyltransferase